MSIVACPSSSSATRRSTIRQPGYYYVLLPRPLLTALRDTPLAIGVYAAIARVFRATKAPVPLSPADLRAYDPTISEGAARRALNRLTELGYLVVMPSGGRRNAYHPSWGRVNGVSRLWELADSALARPRHISAEQLPQALLDHYIGRLEPHALRGAHVTRYISEPLLSLSDVGAYALAIAGYQASRPALQSLGLIVDGQRLALPGLEELLALVSQRRLFDAGSPITLTAAGWSRLGLTPAQPRASGSPLVFVPRPPAGDPSGYQIGQLIATPPKPEQPLRASQRPRGRAAPPAQGSHGSSYEKGSENHPQPPTGVRRTVGGGSDSPPLPGNDARPSQLKESPAQAQPAALPTPAAARLRQIGVRCDVAETLAHRPLAQIERVITQARRQPNVRDLAAWVVSVLRALPAEELPVAPPPPKVSDLAILTHPGLSNAERLRWLVRFRNADLVDRPVILSRFLHEHPRDTSV